jgi:catechol 2,3-dioxygenase-like lactoylglutathione lyase family enzyme
MDAYGFTADAQPLERTNMLRDTDAVATLAVKDLDAAARFYEETLGLSRAGAEDGEAIAFESGDTAINLYRSSFAGMERERDVAAILESWIEEDQAMLAVAKESP